MAKISYDVYSQEDEIIVITNADMDRACEVSKTTFEKPGIKFKLLEVMDISSFSVASASTKELENSFDEVGDAVSILEGKVPGWKLIGFSFSSICADFNCIYEHPLGAEKYEETSYDELDILCSSNFAIELEVDYVDGLPPRRYLCKQSRVSDTDDVLTVSLLEMQGTRKIREITFTDAECDYLKGQLCHITDY